MLFTTSQFFFFYIVILALYWKGPRILPRNLMLLLASWYFYAFGEAKFLNILLLTTSLDFICGKLIGRAREEGRDRAAFGLIVLSVVTNILILSFFKLGWFLSQKWPFFKDFYITESGHQLLPIGISFYTFQSLAYTIDVYRKKIPACKNFVDFALYVAFFPQLVAGPIERAGDLLPQLQSPQQNRFPSTAMIQRAAWLILWGLTKKIAIADHLMPYTRWGVSELQLQTGLDVWLASTAFILEFLCDFSAYTDIAIGLALLFGVQLSENFAYPYFSTSPREFWRRWHMTLGTWFRDYFYRPLRNKGIPRAVATLLTMTTVGIWHGAEPRFFLWGLIWGALMILEGVIAPLLPTPRPGSIAGKLRSFAGWFFVMTAWIWLGFLFVCHSVRDASILFERSLSLSTSHRFWMDLLAASYFLIPFLIIETLQWLKKDRCFWFNWSLSARVAFVLSLIFFLMGNYGVGGNEFIYFAF